MTLIVAKNRRNEELLFSRWVSGHYDYEATFEQFKKELYAVRPRSAKSIIREVNSLAPYFKAGIKKVNIEDGNL